MSFNLIGFNLFIILLNVYLSHGLEAVVFPATVLQHKSQSSIGLSSSVFNSNDSLVTEISKAAEAFSLEYFQHLSRSKDAAINTNFITSPFSIWSLLLILTEGAGGTTHEQLTTVLHLPKDLTKIRLVYKYLQHAFTKENNAIELISNQILFSDQNRPINIEFEHDIEHTYAADYIAVNFQDPHETVKLINDYVRQKVKGKITEVIDVSALSEAQLVLLSVLYFQGHWKEPFQDGDTADQPFYNENGIKIATVPTMFRKGGCTHIRVPNLEADIIELAYGVDRTYSMVIMLPFKNRSLINVIDNLRILGLKFIIENLDKTEIEDDLEVYLPRFTVKSDLRLNEVLHQMGLTHVFDARLANFTRITRNQIWVSQFKQKSIIEVNERGTIAAAVAEASISFQNLPPTFQVNRPFAFMIIERTTNSILFCGQIKNPAQQ